MKKLLEEILKSIVEKKESVLVEEEKQGELNIIKISVDKSEMGKIIGRQGKIIKAIRNVAKILSIKLGKKVRIDLLEQ